MTRIYGGAALLLAVVLALTCQAPSVAAAKSKASGVEVAPKMKPCMYYPGDGSEGSWDQCGTNDNFTIALKRNQINSVYGKLLFDDILTNHECEKTLTDKEGCLAPTNPNKCIWYNGNCQSNSYVTLYKLACDGSKAKMYYECLARFQTEGFCNGSKNCAWAPQLSNYSSDAAQTSCYLKDVAGMTGEEWDQWVLDNIGNADPKAYAANWGTCSQAKGYYNSRAYRSSCASAKDQQTCNDRACEWSPPSNKGKCAADPGRNYALRLAGGGLIREQFMQCFSPGLTAKGAKACNDFTLA